MFFCLLSEEKVKGFFKRVWRKVCTRPASGEALDFTAQGDGVIQHWKLHYPARNRLDYGVRIDRSMIHPALAKKNDWGNLLRPLAVLFFHASQLLLFLLLLPN